MSPPLYCRAEANAEGSESDWAKTPIGSIAKGAVHDVKDYGIVCDLEANPDVVGLAATHQVHPQKLLEPGKAPTVKLPLNQLKFAHQPKVGNRFWN